MKTKRVRPILVESKDIHSQLEIDSISIGKLSYEAKQYHCKHPQELILISLEDEEIEENDYYYFSKSNSLHKHLGTLPLNKYKHDGDKCFKVIARQSQISPEYISKFIEQYNKDCIEDLDIETENKISIDGHTVIGIEPKITNGFVTIVEKEAISYTEEEVINMLGLFGKHIMTHPDLDFGEEFEEAIIWFENNKKK